jgi:hypothetical protein
MVPGKNVTFHRFKFILPWRNKHAQNCIVNWGAEDPSSSQHCQKVFDKDGSSSSSKLAPDTNFFSTKSI